MAWPTPGDCGGANIDVLSSISPLSGVFYNIGRFTLHTGYTITLGRYNSDSAGNLAITAREIFINGSFYATGKGYSGGGGGGGWGNGNANGSPGAGFDGGSGGSGVIGGDGGSSSASGGIGGYDSAGYTRAATAGGYKVVGGQGDVTSDNSVVMGSGGGGGYGAYFELSSSGGGGGAAGYTGGGMIKLRANKIVIAGTIYSNNYPAGNGQDPNPGAGAGGYGGSSGAAGSSVGGPGGGNNGENGAFAAGGGILLEFISTYAQVRFGPLVEISGTIDNRGGLGTTNGGTLKALSPNIKTLGATIQTGRLVSVNGAGTDFALVRPFGAIAG